MEKRKQLKNKKLMAVVAIALMVALVAGMGAMTYAKYVSSAEVPAQSATAAKWGFVVNANADKLFGKNYEYNATNSIATVVTTDGVAVKAAGDSNVVAPGTSGSMTVTVSGTAEVMAKLSFNVTFDQKIALGTYEPVKWTLKEGTEVVGTENMSSETLVSTLNALTAKINAGEGHDVTYTISWKWDFESEGNNVKDTAIGYKAMGKDYDAIKTYISGVSGDDYNAITTELSFDLKVTVEQIQTAE